VVGASSLGASFAIHAFLVGAGALIVSASPDRPAAPIGPADDIAIDVGSPTGGGRLPSAHVDAPPDDPAHPMPWTPGGREDPARPDTGRPGRGGSRHAEAPALNLAERDEGLTLSRDPTSRIDRNQVQRLHTSTGRSSDEDRRALSDPMDLVFVATGTGRLKERRPRADTDPDQGALRAPSFSSIGRGTVALPPDDASDGDFSRRDPAGVEASPGLGVVRGSLGAHHRSAAAVTTGRPLVPKGPEAFVAEEKGPAVDHVNSEQEVAATLQSLIHASTAGGLAGSGSGGEEAPGFSGSGGPEGPGSQAVPFGGGPGPFTALVDDDPHVSNYWRGVRAKIDPLWAHAFPKWASLEGRQGWAVISFVILANGQVDDLRIARPSGVSEFDENLRRAVLSAAPFEPLPAVIAASSMRWSITFDMRNPAVR
jgi:TonB family protein